MSWKIDPMFSCQVSTILFAGPAAIISSPFFHFPNVSSMNSSTLKAALFFSFLLSSGSFLSRCKSVATVGGAISMTLIFVSLSWARRFIDQKCTHAFVPLYTGLTRENGTKPRTEDTLATSAIGLVLKCESRLSARCMGPRILISISWSALLPNSSGSISLTSSGRCTPALLTRQSRSGCSDISFLVKAGIDLTSPVSRT
eukprot:Amastigsp_a531895_4.p2 type:complete len:200 gc:universal Amastigsp_a531895_4:78-677(+)